MVAIAELREELGRRVAARYGGPRVYRDHKELLATEEFNDIVASQLFERHGVLVPDLLKVAVPVFTEKRLAGSIEAGVHVAAIDFEDDAHEQLVLHCRIPPGRRHTKALFDLLAARDEVISARIAS